MHKLFRGFLLISIVLFCVLVTDRVQASDAYFVWEKYVIDVPLNASIKDYEDEYIVKFYVNGKESKDFTIEKEVNYSTFSTVLTHIVGKYTVYYKAYSKVNYVSSIQGIVFNVCDVNAPEITLKSPVVEIEVGSKLKDINWYSVTDDTTPTNEIKVVIDDSSVIYNTKGVYFARITATDKYENSSSENFSIRIVDTISPTILILKPLVFEYDLTVNYSDYFMCKDNYDNDVTNRLIIEGLNTKILGLQEIKLSVSDYSNNLSELIVEVNIVDTEAPTIKLIEDEIMLDIILYSDYNVDFFYDYIYRISDNYSTRENIIVQIDILELEKAVSDYNVYYKVIDQNENTTTASIKVKIREFIGPQLIIDDFIEIKLGTEVDLYSLVEVYDEYDSLALERLEIDSGNFDFNVAGSYTVKYTCFNTSGLYTEKTVTVKVIDDSIENVTQEISLQPYLFYAIVAVVILGIIIFVIIIQRRTFSI